MMLVIVVLIGESIFHDDTSTVTKGRSNDIEEQVGSCSTQNCNSEYVERFEMHSLENLSYNEDEDGDLSTVPPYTERRDNEDLGYVDGNGVYYVRYDAYLDEFIRLSGIGLEEEVSGELAVTLNNVEPVRNSENDKFSLSYDEEVKALSTMLNDSQEEESNIFPIQAETGRIEDLGSSYEMLSEDMATATPVVDYSD